VEGRGEDRRLKHSTRAWASTSIPISSQRLIIFSAPLETRPGRHWGISDRLHSAALHITAAESTRISGEKKIAPCRRISCSCVLAAYSGSPPAPALEWLLRLFCRVIPAGGGMERTVPAGAEVTETLSLSSVSPAVPLFGADFTRIFVIAATPRVPAAPAPNVFSCVRVALMLSSASVSIRFNRLCRMRSFSTAAPLAERGRFPARLALLTDSPESRPAPMPSGPERLRLEDRAELVRR
jgi:hypothetical protein